MKPSIWGKHYWFVFHVVAIKYPEAPTSEDKEAFIHFYRELWRFIPCSTCSTNYIEHLKQFPVDNHLENTKDLFEWTVDFHNIVNKSLGKPRMSLHDAIEKYSQSEPDTVSAPPSDNAPLLNIDNHIAINIMMYINALCITLTIVFIVWIWKKR